MKSFVFGSVCSGIEAASVAFGPLGMHPAWLSEIEPFPSAVLAHHYPEVPNLGDMTAIAARVLAGEIYPPDMLCGGTPCQAFSVAGLRKSLDDARGNLSLVFCELANAIDQRRADLGLDPSIVFWENVPGVLNTSDNAFGCFLAGLAGEDNPLAPPRGKWTNAGYVSGPKRTVAWRVLDAQYFGVAQRRRRVFVIASARDHFDPAAILFEFDGLRRDSAPSREAGKVAPTIPSRSTAGGGLGTDFDLDGGVITMAHGQGGAEIGFDRGPCLTCNHEAPIAAYSTKLHNTQSNQAGKVYEEYATSLDANSPPPAVFQPIAFHPTQDPISSTDGSTHAMGTGNRQGCATVAVAQPTSAAFKYTMGAKAHGIGYAEEQSPTLDTKADSNAVLTPAMAVRRLTPGECERLQGFPDNYTAIPWRKKPAGECPDGPRYKALGNSWAVPCVSWIGQRIRMEVVKGLA
jgi:DNA (cytosine-5)-methyltransferase 1